MIACKNVPFDVIFYRHPVADQRIAPCSIFRTLQKSDRILLPDNDEVQSTKLGDALSTSNQLYPDLQSIYAEA